jgi:hypothetical protein
MYSSSDGLFTVVLFAAHPEDVDEAPINVRLHGGKTIEPGTMAVAIQSARLRAKQIIQTLSETRK